jgi:hypothetical protein
LTQFAAGLNHTAMFAMIATKRTTKTTASAAGFLVRAS